MKIKFFKDILSSVRIEFKVSANQRIIKVEIKCEIMVRLNTVSQKHRGE
jgi:hypothetical protein